MTDRERLMECFYCKYLEICNIDYPDADILEDEDGHCKRYEIDEMVKKGTV